MDRHLGAVWTKISASTPDEVAAAGVSELVWLRLAQRLAQIDGLGDVRAWLLTVAELEAGRVCLAREQRARAGG